MGLDILGPLPESSLGNKYILVVSDYFTKWIEAYPMPNQETVTIANVLVNEFISRFGVPLLLHSVHFTLLSTLYRSYHDG